MGSWQACKVLYLALTCVNSIQQCHRVLALLSDCGWTSIPLTAHGACHILRVHQDRISVFDCD